MIGLLPFFIPVYLWKQGLSLAGLCALLGISGFAFCIALHLWQYMARNTSLYHIIGMSFLLELLLALSVSLSALENWTIVVLCTGAANGFYNAFFWTTQRALFLQRLGNNDSGKRYGNLQILVTVFLKLGILLGGFLLDLGGMVSILLLSAGISLAANWHLGKSSISRVRWYPEHCVISLRQSLRFKDQRGSRSMFTIDGVFLYLESHFWTLSLFLLVRQDFSQLGIVVVFLVIVFSALFFIIKNRIDHMPAAQVYSLATCLYALSWLLRFALDEGLQGVHLMLLLILITFCSSFFRLSFNKQFFDIAQKDASIDYLLMKSFASQCVLGIVFLLFAVAVHLSHASVDAVLTSSYLGAALFSLIYLRYRYRAGSEIL